jgi:hypothetical protein
MKDIDRLLEEEAAEWRARQRPPRAPDIGRFTSVVPGRQRFAIGTLLAAVVLIVAVVALVRPPAIVGPGASGTPSPPASAPAPSPTPTPVPLPSGVTALLEIGDRVSATGNIVLAQGGVLTVCRPLPSDDVYRPPGQELPLECSPLGVPITGVDPASVPEWTKRGTTEFSWVQVTVTGRWEGAGMAVDHIERYVPVPEPSHLIPPPCPAPAGGWGDNSGLPDDGPGSRTAVSLEIARRSDHFSEPWSGHPDLTLFGPTVIDVGTIGDPAVDQAALAKIYRGNICVYPVALSKDAFQAIARRIAPLPAPSSTPFASWTAQADPVSQRVLLRVLVFDRAALERIGDAVDIVVVEPFVKRLGP